MSEHTLTTVIEGNLLSVLLFFEGQRVDINNGGSGTFKSTNTIEVTGALNVTLVARGIAPASWHLTITEGGDELVDESGAIGPGNISTFSTSVVLPDAGPQTAAAVASKKSGKKSGKKPGKKSGKKSGGKKGGK